MYAYLGYDHCNELRIKGIANYKILSYSVPLLLGV